MSGTGSGREHRGGPRVEVPFDLHWNLAGETTRGVREMALEMGPGPTAEHT